jgi:endogenous inhibitor of DNA gyrase (YacG/DUF329 family)
MVGGYSGQCRIGSKLSASAATCGALSCVGPDRYRVSGWLEPIRYRPGPDLPWPCLAAVSLLKLRAGPSGTEAWKSLNLVKTMSSTALVPCPDCAHSVSRLAESCPSCGRPLRKPASREGLFLRTLNQLVALGFWGPIVLLAVIALAVLAGVLSSR